MQQKSFILKNEHEVNKIVSKILLWSIITFPAVLLLSKPFVGFFPSHARDLLIPSIFGSVAHLIPSILIRMNVRSEVIKYVAIFAANISVGIVVANPHMYVSLILLFPIALSLLYFDKKLTTFTLVISMVNMFVSMYIFEVGCYALGAVDNIIEEFIWDTTIYAIEIFALSLIYMMLARRTRNLLESLMSSEEQTELFAKLKDVMNQSAKASDVLAQSVSRLSVTFDENTAANNIILQNANNASVSCEENLKYIETTAARVESTSGVLDTILIEAEEMSGISKDTAEAASESERIIKQAVANMQEIEGSTMESKVLMNTLGKRSEQIGKIIEMIAGISRQTNLLALNAAIESVRAGDHGRGFSVVATEIGKLAEQSATATREIAGLIKQVQADTENAVDSIDKSTEIIKAGIGLVRTAGHSFERLKQFQENLNRKAQQIAVSCKETSLYGREILQMISDIQDLTTRSMGEVEMIATSMQQQLASMNEIAVSVSSVDDIAGDLLDLSKSIHNFE